MAGVGLGIGHARSGEAAARLCCALLAALALALLARIVWKLLPHDDAAWPSPPAAADALAAVPARSLASWHLFGETPQRPGAGGAGAGSTRSLILRGTVAEADPKAGLAVIADAGGGERAWRVGDEVAPGTRLAAVYPDRAVFLRDGLEEVLNLPRERGLAPADIVRPTPATVAGRAAAGPTPALPNAVPAARPSAGATPSGLQQTVAALRERPDELLRRVPVEPVLEGGKLAGVRLAAGADAALLGQVGLRPGDVVTRVNGQPVDSLARGREILASLGGAGTVRVTVLRDGQPAELTVGLP